MGVLQDLLDGDSRVVGGVALAVGRHAEVGPGVRAVLKDGVDNRGAALVLHTGREAGQCGYRQGRGQRQRQKQGHKLFHDEFPFLTFVIDVLFLEVPLHLSGTGGGFQDGVHFASTRNRIWRFPCRQVDRITIRSPSSGKSSGSMLAPMACTSRMLLRNRRVIRAFPKS